MEAPQEAGDQHPRSRFTPQLNALTPSRDISLKPFQNPFVLLSCVCCVEKKSKWRVCVVLKWHAYSLTLLLLVLVCEIALAARGKASEGRNYTGCSTNLNEYGSLLSISEERFRKYPLRKLFWIKNSVKWKSPARLAEKRENGLAASAGNLDFSPVRGARDFYPEQMMLRNWLFSKWKETSEGFAFQPYDAPIVERLDTLLRKGNALEKQMYTFKDKKGRNLALRPEMTPSLMRMISAKQKSLFFPLKWYSISQCWRYERSMRGRRREHYQWNMDIAGIKGVAAEAELIAAVIDFFNNVEIRPEDVEIRISSVKLMSFFMESCLIPYEKRFEAFRLIDKLPTLLTEAHLFEELKLIGLEDEQIKKLLYLLKECDSLKAIELLGPPGDVVAELDELFRLARGYGIENWLVLSPKTVRGLQYYSGIVFEGFSKTERDSRAIFGGGRYDCEFEDQLSKKIPAVGFGLGDEMLLDILRSKRKDLYDGIASLPSMRIAHAVVAPSLALKETNSRDEENRLDIATIRVIRKLRSLNLKVWHQQEGVSLKDAALLKRAKMLRALKIVTIDRLDDENEDDELKILDISSHAISRCKASKIEDEFQ